MADFCKQCSRDMGFKGNDLADLGRGKSLPKDHGWSALCEGCGPTLVDNSGKCIVSDCLKMGHKNGKARS